MAVGTITAIVIIVVFALAVVVVGVIRQTRRRKLRRRFGAEYDRLVDDRQNRRQAETELVMRQRHVAKLGIRPLDPGLRDRYAAEWAATQESFVDMPANAVVDAQHLVNAVLQGCGYPLMHREQVISDLSVDHAGTLDHFRAACDISERIGAGTASTEDMRLAMIRYRMVFTELLGQPASTVRTSARPGPIPVKTAPRPPLSIATAPSRTTRTTGVTGRLRRSARRRARIVL